MSVPEYTLVRSRRRTLAIQVTAAGEVILRCPMGLPKKTAEQFLAAKKPWVEEKLRSLRTRPVYPKLTEAEIQEMRREALPFLRQRAEVYAPLAGVTFGKLSVRAQRTRWGSCNQRGDLSFNCLLMLAPPEVIDYVVVHELCHIRQMNHGPRFWAAVEEVLPDFRGPRTWLRENGGGLMARLPGR